MPRIFPLLYMLQPLCWNTAVHGVPCCNHFFSGCSLFGLLQYRIYEIIGGYISTLVLLHQTVGSAFTIWGKT